MNELEKIKYLTWLVCINIDNVRENYMHAKNLGEQLLTCDDYDFKVIVKNEFIYQDTIDFDFVDFAEVREHFAEMI